MASVIERFPLFPLGLVLLPTEVVPLHIFEERYKTMIGECLAEEREFGIVWLSDDGLREIGCGASVERVLEEMPDGRMNIAAQGTRPFRLLRRIEDLPYPAGDIELLSDGASAEPAAGETARERFADLVERATDERPSGEELAGLDSYAIAARVELELSAKQELLELRDEAARLERLGGLLEGAIERFEYAERAAERASRNGNARA